MYKNLVTLGSATPMAFILKSGNFPSPETCPEKKEAQCFRGVMHSVHYKDF